MTELFEQKEKCGICSKEFEFYSRIVKVPVFTKEPHKGFDYGEPVLIEADDVEYVHRDCLLGARK